jgi:hypothetical protein
MVITDMDDSMPQTSIEDELEGTGDVANRTDVLAEVTLPSNTRKHFF